MILGNACVPAEQHELFDVFSLVNYNAPVPFFHPLLPIFPSACHYGSVP